MNPERPNPQIDDREEDSSHAENYRSRANYQEELKKQRSNIQREDTKSEHIENVEEVQKFDEALTPDEWTQAIEMSKHSGNLPEAIAEVKKRRKK